MVDRSHKGDNAPAVPFLAPDGSPATLASFRGKPLIVNLWATWCGPCVKEMPQLDALAGSTGGRFKLIAISQNMEGKKLVDPFFAEHKLRNLEPYLDKQNVMMTSLSIDSLPLTIMYDARGKEIWRVIGVFDWSGADAKALIEEGAGA